MTTLRTAAQQALEAMSSFESGTNGLYEGEFAQEIAALKAALAEPVQEPVAWLFTNVQSGDYDVCYCEDEHAHDREMWHKQPLYAAPPQRPAEPATIAQADKQPKKKDSMKDVYASLRRKATRNRP